MDGAYLTTLKWFETRL